VIHQALQVRALQVHDSHRAHLLQDFTARNTPMHSFIHLGVLSWAFFVGPFFFHLVPSVVTIQHTRVEWHLCVCVRVCLCTVVWFVRTMLSTTTRRAFTQTRASHAFRRLSGGPQKNEKLHLVPTMAAALICYWVGQYLRVNVFPRKHRMVYDEWNGYHWVDWDHDEEAYARAMTGSAEQRKAHANVCYICGDFPFPRGNAALGNAALGNAALGNAALGNTALGNAALGNAALGNAALGNGVDMKAPDI
jgi:hypothetical protein